MNFRLQFDNKYTCDHLVDLLNKIMKYQNTPLNRRMGLQISLSLCVYSRYSMDLVQILTGNSLTIIYGEQVAQEHSLDKKIF